MMLAPRRLLSVVVLATLLAAQFRPAACDESSETRSTVSPPPRAALSDGAFHLIYRDESTANGAVLVPLTVDGRSHAWEGFASPLGVAQLELAPGKHRLAVGERSWEVLVVEGDEPVPEGWHRAAVHAIDEDGDRCAACHETQSSASGLVVGEAKSYKACLECHSAIEFEVIHSHPLEPLEHCQMCHGIHGAPEPALLKLPVKKLCDECHES